MYEKKEKKVLVMEYSFEKSEYNYYATALIFGSRSPKLKDFSAFSLDIFKDKNLHFSEHSRLNTDDHMEITRHLNMGDDRYFESSHSDMRSEINRVITYVDSAFKFHLSDSVFSDSEFKYFEENWDATVQNKIRTLGILIKSIYERKIRDIPILINEYENITKTLLDRVDFFLVGKNVKHR
jgi:hypothetical protein